MSTVPIGDIVEAQKIEHILEDNSIDDLEKSHRLDESRRSRRKSLTGKRSSFETIFNVSNTMMGSALLVMPVKFYSAGMFSSVISACIMGLISYYTCNLIISHSKDSEIDYPEAVERILGKVWAKIYNALSGFLLFLVGVIHFILMGQTFYAILNNIFSLETTASWEPSNSQDIVFNKFSLQYVGFVMFVLCALIFSIKDLKHILAVNDKGVYMIMIFSVFIIYLGIDSASKGNIDYVVTGAPGQAAKGLEVVLFTADVENLISIFALAYMIHNAIAGIMKNNKDSSKNSRDLFSAYSLVWILYCILGIAGMVAVAGLYNAVYLNYKPANEGDPWKLPGTIMELLDRHNTYLSAGQYIAGSIGLSLIFIQLSTVIPILCFFTRRQFFDLIFGQNTPVSSKWFHLFNFVFNLLCLIIQMVNFPIGQVIGLTGAVGGLMLIYFIPIYVHLKCLYLSDPGLRRSSLYMEKPIHKEVLNSDTNELSNQILPKSKSQRCRNHSNFIHGNPLYVYAFYTFLMLFGIAIFVGQIYDMFK
jgi:sodium-coupled neutral amino acid transporter 9